MRTCVLLMLVACTSPPDEPTRDPRLREVPTITPTPSPTPGQCDAAVSLYGASGSATPTTVPFAINTSDGVNICLELDARDNIVVGHFAASTQREQDATTSMFQLALFAKDGELLQEGWDVTFGDAPPVTFANLEYGVTKGTMVEVTLHISAKCVPLGTTVDLALFEPYE
jgi:hypothetical protein